jgi:3-oxoacyl-[acyl-carrier protein] reductase
MLLEHKKAVIYGAAGAIGRAVARVFAREGANLFLAGRTRARVESVAEEISAAGGVAEAAEVDALDEDATDKHMDDVVARAQRIDVLFNAIGMDDVQGTLLVDMSAEDFAQPVIKATRTQFLTAPHHGGYGVACAAVEGLWRSFAAELGPHGIRLVILRSAGSPVAPDIKQTFEHHAQAAGISPEEFLAEASSGTLLRRLPMLSEVAEAAVMMASDRASAMTGVMANVTCGSWVDV